MTDLATLRALAARIEAATGPDREMDREIEHVVCGVPRCAPGMRLAYPGQYTESLDAAVALVERVLPGWWWDVCTYEGGKYEAFVNPPTYRNPDEDPCGMGIRSTSALALCLALVRAMIARLEPKYPAHAE